MRVPLLAAAMLLAAARGAAAVDGCPEARRALAQRRPAEAERLARACLQAAPADVATWTILARALAAGSKYDQALGWLGKARARYPADADLALSQARVLAWSGRRAEAWHVVRTLAPAALGDPEDAVFVANLAVDRRDPAEAGRLYEAVLARWPDNEDALRGRGALRESQGDLDGAAGDFDTLCRVDAERCLYAEGLAERRSRIRLRLAPAYTVIDRGDDRRPGWSLPAALDVRASPAVTLGLALDRRTRDFGAGPRSDLFVQASLGLRLGARGGLGVAAGTTFGRQFSPRWTAEIEPSLGLGWGLVLSLKYWRLDFPDGGAHVVSPAVLREGERWTWYGRYFLTRPDPDPAGVTPLRHAAFGRVSRLLGPRLLLSAGGGAGSGVDYLEIRQGGSGSFWFAMAGAGYKLGWRHRITVDYVFRHESTDRQAFTQHNVALGYELRL